MINKINKSIFTKDWHNYDVKEALDFLEVNVKTGLSSRQVKERQGVFGQNKLPAKKEISSFVLFLKQFQSPLIYILIIAGIVMFFVGDWTDTLVIFAAVILNAIFGYWEEHKTLNILEKLKKTLETKAYVLRDGQKKEIFQEELVPGDIVFLTSGSRVPADGRLLEANNLKISEAVLTGEWMSASKTTSSMSKEAHLAERHNMAYSGSLVESGLGKMAVTGVGKYTETGKIATLVREAKEEPSPLQKKLAQFGKTIGILISILATIIFIGGVIRGDNVFKIFEASVAMAVGGIPEALPVVMTVILVIGMDRLLKKRGLIRKLSSVETLGSTSIICLDKTKTLTQGQMELAEVKSDDKFLTFKIGALCNEAFVENPSESLEKWRIKGSPTDRALLSAGHKQGIFKMDLEKRSIEIDHLPFDSKYKYQVNLRQEKDAKYIYITGAPERLLAVSKNKDAWQKKIDQLASRGLRVVGTAYKKVDKKKKKILKSDVKDFNFVGLLAFKDPLRPDIKQSINLAKKAGLKPIIITGDFSQTAQAIANEAGISVQEDEIIEGRDLDNLTDAELEKKCTKIKIYARSEPKHKIRIVKAWQRKGKAVAMVGDGVNDSPAIKQADIGIALGSGTEVAKEAADLVLLDDSFSVIIEAIREGRVILDNLRKSIAYVLADSFASVILIGTTNVILGWPLPILPVQILWNNLVEDTLPNIAYAFEPGEKNVMRRGPSPIKVPLLNKEMKILIFGTGLIDEFLTVLLFWYMWKYLALDLAYVRTMIFGAISLDTAFVVYSYKNLRKNIWEINLFSNKWLLASSATVFLAFILAVYVPVFQKVLHTVPIGISSWLVLIGVGIISVLIIELTKWYFIAKHETEN